MLRYFHFNTLIRPRAPRLLVLCLVGLVLSIIVLSHVSISFAAEVTLAWDPSFEPDVVGYRIHYGMESGRYDWTIEISNVGLTSYVIDDLRAGTYFVAATAFNQSRAQSDYSNEVVKSVVIN